MQAQEKQPLGLPDRVVKITGTPDQLLRAVALLLTKLVESPNYTRFTTSNVSYGPPLAPVRPPPLYEQCISLLKRLCGDVHCWALIVRSDGQCVVVMQARSQRHASALSIMVSAAVRACAPGVGLVLDQCCMAVKC